MGVKYLQWNLNNSPLTVLETVPTQENILGYKNAYCTVI